MLDSFFFTSWRKQEHYIENIIFLSYVIDLRLLFLRDVINLRLLRLFCWFKKIFISWDISVLFPIIKLLKVYAIERR